MPEIATAAADTGVETPVVILTPQDATAEHIARGLSPEQAKAFRANRREKKAKAAAAVAAAPPKPVAEAKPDAETQRAGVPALPSTEAEVIHFDAPEETPAATADESPAEISEDELAKLDEKARKRITDASKEAAKVRKRAQ